MKKLTKTGEKHALPFLFPTPPFGYRVVVPPREMSDRACLLTLIAFGISFVAFLLWLLFDGP